MKKQIMWGVINSEGYVVNVYWTRHEAREDVKYLNDGEVLKDEKFKVMKVEVKVTKEKKC